MNKSKWNWGTGILITIILFLIITISTTVFLMNQKVDLVSSDYYNKGIQHQQQIDRLNRTNAMDDKVLINLENGFVKIVFPNTISQNSINGKIQFYRPSDSGKDFSVPLLIDTTGQQIIPTQNIIKGYWKVSVEWMQDSVEYYKESSFVIN